MSEFIFLVNWKIRNYSFSFSEIYDDSPLAEIMKLLLKEKNEIVFMTLVSDPTFSDSLKALKVIILSVYTEKLKDLINDLQ